MSHNRIGGRLDYSALAALATPASRLRASLAVPTPAAKRPPAAGLSPRDFAVSASKTSTTAGAILSSAEGRPGPSRAV